MIAQQNGKIIRVDGKIIMPMIGNGPSSSTELLNPADVASYLSYFYNLHDGMDVPFIGRFYANYVNGEYGRNRIRVSGGSIWNYYYYLYNDSDTYDEYGELEISPSYVGKDVMTSSVLASIFDGSGGGGNSGRRGKIYLNSNICFILKDYYDMELYTQAVEISIRAEDADGTKTKVAYGWTKSSDGMTATKTFPKIGVTSTHQVFPWIRLTLIKNYYNWYAYVNDNLVAVFYAEIERSKKIRFVGDGSGDDGGSLRLTEVFTTTTDIALGHREKLNLIYEPTFNGNLPSNPFYTMEV